MWPCSCISRLLNTQSLEWFYNNVRRRFKRFGSAKVLKNLYRRHAAEHGVLAELTGTCHLDCYVWPSLKIKDVFTLWHFIMYIFWRKKSWFACCMFVGVAAFQMPSAFSGYVSFRLSFKPVALSFSQLMVACARMCLALIHEGWDRAPVVWPASSVSNLTAAGFMRIIHVYGGRVTVYFDWDLLDPFPLVFLTFK